jgi:hypothetical protein
MPTVTEKPDAPPVRCPTCAALVAAVHSSKADTTYLRCDACGDVWNPSRRVPAYEPPRYFRFGSTSR